MSETQTPLLGFNQRAQDSVHQLMDNWISANEEYGLGPTESENGVSSAEDVLKNWFDFAERVLRIQREFATGLLAGGAEITETAWKAAEKASQPAHAASCRAEEARQAVERPTRNNTQK